MLNAIYGDVAERVGFELADPSRGAESLNCTGINGFLGHPVV
jgi:hypothetical protein